VEKRASFVGFSELDSLKHWPISQGFCRNFFPQHNLSLVVLEHCSVVVVMKFSQINSPNSWDKMRLNKYLFNRVNNKERERGQRSVIWLIKHGQPCLHRLHVLSTVFSWQPFSSFILWIILLPSDSRCRLPLWSNRFLSTLFSATPGFCAIVVYS